MSLSEQGQSTGFRVDTKCPCIGSVLSTAEELALSKELLELAGFFTKEGGWHLDLETMSWSWTLETLRIADLESPEAPLFSEGINPFTAEARLVVSEAVQSAIESGKPKPYNLTLPLITANRRCIWVHTQGYAERRNGKSVRLFGTIHDITAGRRLSEDRLRAIERENSDLRMALDEHAIVAITDNRGRITFANDKFCEISEYSRDELIGQDHRLINSGHHSKDFIHYLWATIKSGDPWHGEICNRSKSGSLYWVDTTIIPFRDDSGGIRQFVAIRKDISARKRAESDLLASEFRWKFAIEGSGDGLWDWDLASDSVYFSKRWKESLGYSDSEVGTSFEEWRKRVHPDDLEPAMKEVLKHVAGETQGYENEHRMLCKDGSWKWILARGLVLERDSSGKPLRMIGTHTDISQRKEAERALGETEERLRQSQKLEALGTLAGGIAHDFNNILSGIYGFASLAREAAHGMDEALDYIDEIRKAGRRAAKLVAEILAFSRAESELLESLNFGYIVSEVVDLLKVTIPPQIEFKVEGEENLPRSLGNSTQLHQVVMNLCTNAVQVIGKERGVLELSIKKRRLDDDEAEAIGLSGGGDFLRLTVSDTGCGMDEATQAKVYEPFFTTKAPGEGTGLGLSVVHGIILNHRGAICLESEIDVGTKIEVYLPVSEHSSVGFREESSVNLGGNGAEILFVDDEALVTRAGVIGLEKLGYKVVGETSSTNALARILREPERFSALITDQAMSDLTGLELATEVLRVRKDLPVVVVSGYHADLTAERIEAAGVREVIAKPYNFEDLAAAVQRWIGTKGR
ncbi:MAG: PAS domain-containing protein [Verrucomicrobiota bacterium]